MVEGRTLTPYISAWHGKNETDARIRQTLSTSYTYLLHKISIISNIQPDYRLLSWYSIEKSCHIRYRTISPPSCPTMWLYKPERSSGLVGIRKEKYLTVVSGCSLPPPPGQDLSPRVQPAQPGPEQRLAIGQPPAPILADGQCRALHRVDGPALLDRQTPGI